MARMFPARAGMSRQECWRCDDHQDVPRASGDEPVSRVNNALAKKCSPRERG